jgi:hypothetical protein
VAHDTHTQASRSRAALDAQQTMRGWCGGGCGCGGSNSSSTPSVVGQPEGYCNRAHRTAPVPHTPTCLRRLRAALRRHLPVLPPPPGLSPRRASVGTCGTRIGATALPSSGRMAPPPPPEPPPPPRPQQPASQRVSASHASAHVHTNTGVADTSK